MAFVFKPAVYRNSQFYELPRPVLSVRIQNSWDYEQFKVPLLAGDTLAGHSLQGVDIALEGQIGSQAGTLKLSEEEMFSALQALREALDGSADEEKYSLFLYHDVATATYRKFRDCSTVRLEWDLSDVALFTYSVVIHAEDPVIYQTAPGA